MAAQVFANPILCYNLVEANTAASGAPNVLTALESRTALTNEGATSQNYHTLPTAVAGQTFTVYCQHGTAGIAAAPVGGITRSGSTATVAMTGHGFSDNDYVLIAGADQAEYNGAHQITKTGDDAFTYAVSGTPDTPATGTITAERVAQGIRVTANTGDTIRLATAVTSPAGCYESFETGACLTLLAVNGVEWVATSIVGTWAQPGM